MQRYQLFNAEDESIKITKTIIGIFIIALPGFIISIPIVNGRIAEKTAERNRRNRIARAYRVYGTLLESRLRMVTVCSILIDHHPLF